MATTFIPQAYCVISNIASIQIQIDDTFERLRYQYCGGQVSRWIKIQYKRDGRTIFKARGHEWNLDRFIRVF